MSTKHTPGPWVYHVEDNIITDGREFRLLEWQARSVHVSAEERDANARLIAAAPELLEVLSKLCALEADGKQAAESAIEAWEQARAAIAKATGEAAS